MAAARRAAFGVRRNVIIEYSKQFAFCVAWRACDAEVLVSDPGRGNSANFSRLLAAQGFEVHTTLCPMDDTDPPPHRGRLLHYRRRRPA